MRCGRARNRGPGTCWRCRPQHALQQAACPDGCSLGRGPHLDAHAVFVRRAQRQPVDLGLHRHLDRLQAAPKVGLHVPLPPRPHLGGTVHSRQAQQAAAARRRVLRLGPSGHRRADGVIQGQGCAAVGLPRRERDVVLVSGFERVKGGV